MELTLDKKETFNIGLSVLNIKMTCLSRDHLKIFHKFLSEELEHREKQGASWGFYKDFYLDILPVHSL